MTTLILQLVLAAALLAAQSQAGGMQSQVDVRTSTYGTRVPASVTLPSGSRQRVTPDGVTGTSNLVPPAQAIKGNATWYDAPSIHDAAAGPALREAIGKHWRGTWVTVSLRSDGNGKTVTVHLTDWCLCSKGHRVIDLDDRAFRELAPLSRGVVPVVVSWGDSIPLPATDTAP